MIEGNSYMMPETAQVIAMAEVEKRSAGNEEMGNSENNMPTFGRIIRNTLITLLGKNVPRP